MARGGSPGRPRARAGGRCRPTGASRASTSSPAPPPPAPSSSRRWAAPRPASTSDPATPGAAAPAFQARRGRLLLHGRRHDLRGRVLGEPQHGLQPPAARPLPRRGQRLRDLRAGGGADRGRQHLEARALVPGPARARGRRLRSPGQPVRAPGGGGLVPRPPRTRPRPCQGDPSLLPFPLRRRDPLPSAGRARRRRRARSAGVVPARCSSRTSSPPRRSCQALRTEVDREVNDAADAALAASPPDPETATRHVYSAERRPHVDGLRDRGRTRRAIPRPWSTCSTPACTTR